MNPLDDIGCISANVHPAAFDTMYDNSQLRYVMLDVGVCFIIRG
ncbi:MAG: hypothetical protein WA667_12860 [Candidatus Nitrosopolaris sp.]